MVVFTCQNCGSSVNKNKVEKHYNFVCKTYPNVTCVDCLKDFKGDEYIAHTQCITEDQKYGSKDYVPKVSSGVKKRATWLNSVELSLETPGLTIQQRKLIKECLNYPNIPQKKKKFINFVKSSFGRQYPDLRLVESVFEIMDACHKKNVEQEKSQNNDNGNVENGDKSTNDDSKTENGINTSSNDVGMVNGKKSKKRKHTEELESAEQADNEIVENKKKKKDKKKHKDSEAEDCQNTTVEDQDVTKESNDDSNIDPINNHSQETDEADKKLTKKERKEKKKRAKYEAELNEIANSKNENNENLENSNGVENNDHDDTEDGTKKKKKKKDKMKHINENNTEITNGNESSGKKRQPEENGSDEPVKKKKKGSHSDFVQENNNGVIESNTTNGNSTFKWDEMIIKVLESRSDKELSINRLSKKIINEYQAIYGEDHMTYEKLMSKFNKKVYKTPGVKVLKDKAKLIT